MITDFITVGVILQTSIASVTQDDSDLWRALAPYAAATVALLVFAVTRYVDIRQKRSAVLEEYAAMAQEVAHNIAEVWRSWPQNKPFDIDELPEWKKAAGDIDGRLTPLLRKVEIIGSGKAVSAAFKVRNAINGLRDAIEFGVEVRGENETRRYVRPPEEAYLVKRWLLERGYKKDIPEDLRLWWERPQSQESKQPQVPAATGLDAIVRRVTSLRLPEKAHLREPGLGWLIAWGVWQEARDEFKSTARRQVGPWWTMSRFDLIKSLPKRLSQSWFGNKNSEFDT